QAAQATRDVLCFNRSDLEKLITAIRAPGAAANLLAVEPPVSCKLVIDCRGDVQIALFELRRIHASLARMLPYCTGIFEGLAGMVTPPAVAVIVKLISFPAGASAGTANVNT